MNEKESKNNTTECWSTKVNATISSVGSGAASFLSFLPIAECSVADPWHFGVDPDLDLDASDKWIRIRIRILLFSSLTFKMPNFFSFSADYFLKVHLHHFSKTKSQKESQNSRNQGFSYYFCTIIEGSGSKPLTNGSGGSGSATLAERTQERESSFQNWLRNFLH